MVSFLILAALLWLIFLYFPEHEEADPPAGYLRIHYLRQSSQASGWELWVWNPDVEGSGRAIHPSRVRGNEAIFEFNPSRLGNVSRIGVLPRYGEWLSKDKEDRYVEISRSLIWFLVEGETQLSRTKPKIPSQLQAAFLDSADTIHVILPPGIEIEKCKARSFHLKDPTGRRYAVQAAHPGSVPGDLILKLEKPLNLPPRHVSRMKVHMRGAEPARLQARGILWDPGLEEEHHMGLTQVPRGFVLRCFAPTAEQAYALLYADSNAQDPMEKIPMKSLPSGAFEVHLREEHEGLWYKFEIHGADFPGQDVRTGQDPYSRLHESPHGPTLIFSKPKFTIAPAPKFEKSSTVIWETHVRDFSVHPSLQSDAKGLYAGMLASSTLPDGQSAGLVHLRELGVNTIHLLPIQEFHHGGKRGYDWGYMPTGWFCPEGWFARNRGSLDLLKEFSDMVNGLHQEGFRVVMDVVFNHTAEPMPPHHPWSFNALAPGYYYRRNHYGHWFNGSGCGNEFKTEAPMARRLVLDCLKYWQEEFKIDGFRFDLMGLMDWETWRSISEEMSRHNPEILLYGEPWAAGGAGLDVVGKGGQRNLNIAVFNDHFRDAVRGDNSSSGWGFVHDGRDSWKIEQGLLAGVGEFAEHPLETISYVACHDNYTLRDKLEVSGIHDEKREAMERLSSGLVLLAQGIPFLQAGQEFGRSKGGCHNSWDQPDEVNAIDWEAKSCNQGLYEWHRNLLQLRHQHRVFRLNHKSQILRHVKRASEVLKLPHGVAGMELKAHELLDSFKTCYVLANGSGSNQDVELPAGEWLLCVDGKNVELKHSRMKALQGRVKIPEHSLVVIVEKNRE